MSLLKTIRQQLGLSGTAANNFTLDASAADGTMKLARGNAGATTQDILTVDASGNLSTTQTFSVATATSPTHATRAGQVKSCITSITGTVGASALTCGLEPCVLDFRSATLGTGTATTRFISSALSLVVPSGATLGTLNATGAKLALLAIDNAGTIELAIINVSGGVALTEDGLITTTTISATADSANVAYSTTGRSSVPYRVVGVIYCTQATAGTWATAPAILQGAGGNSVTHLASLGYGGCSDNLAGAGRVVGTTYYNTSNRPIMVEISGSSSGAGSLWTFSGVIGAGFTWARYSNQAYAGVTTLTVVALVPPMSSYVLANAVGSNSLVYWYEKS